MITLGDASDNPGLKYTQRVKARESREKLPQPRLVPITLGAATAMIRPDQSVGTRARRKQQEGRSRCNNNSLTHMTPRSPGVLSFRRLTYQDSLKMTPVYSHRTRIIMVWGERLYRSITSLLHEHQVIPCRNLAQFPSANHTSGYL